MCQLILTSGDKPKHWLDMCGYFQGITGFAVLYLLTCLHLLYFFSYSTSEWPENFFLNESFIPFCSVAYNVVPTQKEITSQTN